MDLSLPAIDGWEATRQIKGDVATQQIPGLPSQRMRWRVTSRGRLRLAATTMIPSRSILSVYLVRLITIFPIVEVRLQTLGVLLQFESLPEFRECPFVARGKVVSHFHASSVSCGHISASEESILSVCFLVTGHWKAIRGRQRTALKRHSDKRLCMIRVNINHNLQV
jgi:hypothetical protein